MNDAPSLNTRAILLLTAPLIIGREQRSSTRPLAAGEYNRLASRLRDLRRQPGDLLGDGAGALIEECRHDLDAERLDRLQPGLSIRRRGAWRPRLWVRPGMRISAGGQGPSADQAPRLLRLRKPRETWAREAGRRRLEKVGRRLDRLHEGIGLAPKPAHAGWGVALGSTRPHARRAGRRGTVGACCRGRAGATNRPPGRADGSTTVSCCPYDPARGFLVGHCDAAQQATMRWRTGAGGQLAELRKGHLGARSSTLDRHRFVSV